MRVDGKTGMVYRTFKTSLYEYERPYGSLNVNGYVILSLGRDRPQVYAHRLIWTVCTGERATLPLVVNHKNGIKHDNRLENLELVTQARNIAHAYDTGLAPSGERHYGAKLSDEEVRRIHALQFSEGCSATELAAIHSVSQSHINHIWSGQRRAFRLDAA